jgi:NDP-sugar pyrophosphorylase family protein
MKNLLYGGFSTLSDFGGRLNEGSPIWVQGESSDSEKRRSETVQKIKQKKIEIEGAVLIGRHCQIEDGARIVNSCIDNFTRIGKNAVVANSAIMDRVIIDDDAEVYDSIIGRHVVVHSSYHRPTKVTAVSVIADDVTLEEGCSLTTTKVYPHQRIRGEFQNQTIIAN